MRTGVRLRLLGLLLALRLCGESPTPFPAAACTALRQAALYLPVAAGLQNKEEEEMLIGWQGEVSQHIQVRHAPVLPTWSHTRMRSSLSAESPQGPRVAPSTWGRRGLVFPNGS